MPYKSPLYARYDSEASKLRKKHGLTYTEPVNPDTLAKSLEISVIESHDIAGVTNKDLVILKSIGADWSGLSFVLPNDRKIVVLNSFHRQTRKNITLMEEICHHIYNHRPKMRIFLSGSMEINFLDFTQKDEREAYGIAASFLVPYKALRSLIHQHKTIEEIGCHFGVSPELVKFRLNTAGLRKEYSVYQKLAQLQS